MHADGRLGSVAGSRPSGLARTSRYGLRPPATPGSLPVAPAPVANPHPASRVPGFMTDLPGSAERPLLAAIVGSGPAGCDAAQDPRPQEELAVGVDGHH